MQEDVIGKAYDARLMRRLLAYLRPHGPAVGGALVVILGGSLVELAQPWLTQQAIDRAIVPGDLGMLARIAAWYVVLLAAGFVCEYLQTSITQTIGQQIMHRLRMEVFGHLQRLDIAFYDRNPVGRMMTRVTTDVDALNDLFASGVITVFGDLLVLAGIVAAMLAMNWRLAVVAFLVVPLIVLTTQWFRRNVRQSYRQVRGLVARINAFLQEHLTGMSTVQVFGQEARTFDRFDAVNRAHRDVNIEAIFYYALFYPIIELLAALSAALIIWVGGGWALEGRVSIGVLVGFLLYSRRFFQPISDLSDKFNILQAAMAASERIFTLLDTPIGIRSPEDGLGGQPPDRDRPRHAVALRAHPAEGSGDAGVGPRRAVADVDAVGQIAARRTSCRIEFDHVWFAYVGDDYVLRDVSFVVEPGRRVGIVGATGSGKTTLINLLLRFYDARRGRLLVDGVDVRQWDLQALRSRFGLVLQDLHLFSGSIADNIRLGNAAIDDQAVGRAAMAVHADPFIRALPAGYATPVAERGATLSTGQKQLLSFARALAFDPPVLVLDEATSSIDTETEALIQDALNVLMVGRTVLAIAHRLSTIQDVDQILVLHKGELREQGTHQQLLAERGLYYRLYQLQFQSEDRPAPAAALSDGPGEEG